MMTQWTNDDDHLCDQQIGTEGIITERNGMWKLPEQTLQVSVDVSVIVVLSLLMWKEVPYVCSPTLVTRVKPQTVSESPCKRRT